MVPRSKKGRRSLRENTACLGYRVILGNPFSLQSPSVKRGVEGQLEKVTLESLAVLKSWDPVTTCEVVMMIVLFTDKTSEAKRREEPHSHSILVGGRAEGHPSQCSSIGPDLLAGPWKKSLDMTKAWLLLGSPSQVQSAP